MNSLCFKILNLPIYLITLLPLNVLYILSDLFYFLIYYIFQYRKKTVLNNLKNSFPKRKHGEIKKIARLFYQHFCDNTIESIYIYNISKSELNKRYKFLNPGLINALYEKDKSIILTFGHYANWDWLTSLPSAIKHKCMAIYHPLSNTYFNELFTRIRTKYGVKMIPMSTSLKEMMKYSKENIPTLTMFLTDQRPLKSSIRYWLTFLNQETPVLLGAEKIAKKLDQAVVFADIQKIKRGYYEIVFTLISENPKNTSEFEITESHTRKLEGIIQKQPQYWLWSHKRWKHKRINIESVKVKNE